MNEEPESTLDGSVTGLGRRLMVVLVGVATMVAAALGYSMLRTPLYRSTSEVLVNVESTSGVFEPIDDQSTWVHRALMDEANFAASTTVASVVEAAHGTGAASVDVEARTADDVLEISFVSPVPQRASDVANAYAVAYIETREELIIAGTTRTSIVIEQRLRQLETEILADDVSGAERQVLRNQIVALTESLDNLQLGLQRSVAAGSVILTPAVPDNSPVSPRTRRNVIIAALVGLVIGLSATRPRTTDHGDP